MFLAQLLAPPQRLHINPQERYTKYSILSSTNETFLFTSMFSKISFSSLIISTKVQKCFCFSLDKDDLDPLNKWEENKLLLLSSQVSSGVTNSPIFYIKLPAVPYEFHPNLGYISRPPSLDLGNFIRPQVSLICFVDLLFDKRFFVGQLL